MYGIMTEELVICEIRMNEAAGNSDSRMASFEVISHLNSNQLKKSYCKMRCIASRSAGNNSLKRMTCLDKGHLAGWSMG